MRVMAALSFYSILPPADYSVNIFPIGPIQSISKDSQRYYPVSYRTFTFIPSIGVNVA
jgi:hypothetical protein